MYTKIYFDRRGNKTQNRSRVATLLERDGQHPCKIMGPDHLRYLSLKMLLSLLLNYIIYYVYLVDNAVNVYNTLYLSLMRTFFFKCRFLDVLSLSLLSVHYFIGLCLITSIA